MGISQVAERDGGTDKRRMLRSRLSRRAEHAPAVIGRKTESRPTSMYLRRLQISSYKAFSDIDVPLPPLPF